MARFGLQLAVAAQLARGRVDADLTVERGIAPLIEHLDVHEREVVSARLNFGLIRNDLQTTRRTAAHDVYLNGVTCFAVWPNCGGANLIHAGTHVDADEAE